MQVSPVTVFVVLIVFGFLTGSTLYFYSKNNGPEANKDLDPTFQADNLPGQSDEPDKVDSQTQPAEPKGRLSYPANVYKIQPRESLFAIGEKMGVSWQVIKAANGIKDENLVQADYPLVIPKLSQETDYYRINFVINETRASELNKELRDADQSEWYDPIEVAKMTAPPYFNSESDDEIRLVEADYSNGKALVEVKAEERLNYVGLIQPKTKGQKGLWALLYIEDRND